MNIAVTGATGTMGRTVIETATDRPDVTVAFGIDQEVPNDGVHGVRVYAPGELPALLEEQRPNVVVDFSAPPGTLSFVEAAAEAGVAVVIGTTGFDEAGLADLRQASDVIPVLKASNFARGVWALLRAVEAAVEALPGYDIEVMETHHNRKMDAPSGTAKTILDRIDAVRGESDKVYGREGDQPRTEDEVGVFARRAGNVRGEHEVLLAGNDEVLTLTHRAESRRVFAEGALDAAVWLAGTQPGWYGFDHVLEDT